MLVDHAGRNVQQHMACTHSGREKGQIQVPENTCLRERERERGGGGGGGVEGRETEDKRKLFVQTIEGEGTALAQPTGYTIHMVVIL